MLRSCIGHDLAATCVLVASVLIGVLPCSADGPGDRRCSEPITCDEVVTLLQGDSAVSSLEIIKQLERYRTSCSLAEKRNPEVLTNAGADPSLREAIVRYQEQDTFITFPTEGDVLNRYFRIEGCSPKTKSGHLWLSTRAEGSLAWWPQGEVSNLSQDGRWTHEVCIDREWDRGSKFQIAAIWLTPEEYEDLPPNCKVKPEQCPESCADIRVQRLFEGAGVSVWRVR